MLKHIHRIKILSPPYKDNVINKIVFYLAVMLFTTLSTVKVFAEPYLAVRYGQQCSSCHTNMTGGGMRNATGNAYAMGLTSTPISSKFSPQLAEQIAVGANFRADYTYTSFPDADTVEGDSTPLAEIPDSSTFDVSNGSLYLGFEMDETLSFYLDQQVAPEGGRTREALVLYKGLLGDGSYLKAGKFFLPYGLRLQDDQAFIRETTGFNFDNSDIGAEFGWESGALSLAVSLTNGTQGSGENNKDKQVSFVGSFIQPSFRLGISGSKNNAPQGIGNTLYGLFGGFNFGNFAVLGEADWIEEEAGGVTVDKLVGFISGNYLATPSLNIKLSYEYFDPSDDIDEDERTRASLLAEKFLNQYFQIRGGVRVYDGIPQNALQNQDLFFTELHLFF